MPGSPQGLSCLSKLSELRVLEASFCFDFQERNKGRVRMAAAGAHAMLGVWRGPVRMPVRPHCPRLLSQRS